MSQSKLDDLYDRLTSRKLWLAILSVAFGLWNYAEGRLTPVEFQAVVFGAVTAYSLAEGAGDFAKNWHSTPDTTVRTTVNTTTAPEAVTEPPAVTRAPKRVRPSRAKPKPAAPAILTEPVVPTPVRRPRPRPAVEAEVTT